jgi:predicted transcriptional regulator
VIPEIDEIRLLRRQLGLTQQELAKMAGVSQSLIAKIERGLVQPSYGNVKRLVEALEAERNRRHPAVTAGATCSKSIVYAEAMDTVREAANLMRKHGFSQVPVRRRGQIVGSVSDRILSEALATAENPETVGKRRVEEVMAEPFPQVPDTTPLKVASGLLHYAPAVLVTKAGEPVGILTKSDLLKVLIK